MPYVTAYVTDSVAAFSALSLAVTVNSLIPTVAMLKGLPFGTVLLQALQDISVVVETKVIARARNRATSGSARIRAGAPSIS